MAADVLRSISVNRDYGYRQHTIPLKIRGMLSTSMPLCLN